MNQKKVIIVGGGLAGLTAAIHLAKNDLTVTLFEKKAFPHHKVCGEYLSKEVIPYLNFLEIPILETGPAMIEKLLYSTGKGDYLEKSLDLGGLGISRYALDDLFFQRAKTLGVTVKHEKVTEIRYINEGFEVDTILGTHHADYVFGAYGKRSVIDKKLEREFIDKPAQWVAVKSHYHLEAFPENLVALHSFKGGYCGLSKTEERKVNVCYLATYNSFKDHKNPEDFKENVLRENPFLDRFFSEAQPVFKKPLTISQVNFHSKKPVEDHVLMIGDTAGLIHPLCGNGMSMAIHSAKLASEKLLSHLQQNTTRAALEQGYAQAWNNEFQRRISAGKWLQRILLNESLASFSQTLIARAPFLLTSIIKRTHGNPIKIHNEFKQA